MNRFIHSLLVTILVVTPIGCTKSSNQTVSAHSDNEADTATAPGKVKETPLAPPAPLKERPPAATGMEEYSNLSTRNPVPEKHIAREMLTIPAGTAVSIVLDQGLGADNNKEGDVFTGSLADPLVIDGKVVAMSGTEVKGRVVNVKGPARMELELTSLKADKDYKVKTDPFIAGALDPKSKVNFVLKDSLNLPVESNRW